MTARYKYEFGKRWNVRLPRDDIAYLVHRMHCSTDDDTVAGDILDRCRQANIPVSMHDACKQYALLVHRRQKDLYYAVLRGEMR